METYEGNDKDPITLHKYLYVKANSANAIDPTGRDSISEETAAAGVSTTLGGIAAEVVNSAMSIARFVTSVALGTPAGRITTIGVFAALAIIIL